MGAASSWGNKNPDWDGRLGLNGSQDGLKGYLGNYFLFESGFSKFTVQSIKKSLELKHRKAFSFFFRVDLPWVKWIVVDGRWRLTASYWSQHSQCSSARTLLRIFFFPTPTISFLRWHRLIVKIGDCLPLCLFHLIGTRLKRFSDTYWSFISFLCHTRLLCISIAVIIINIMILNHNDHDDHHNLISMLSGHLPWHLFFGWVFLTLHCLWSLSSSSFHHPLNPHHNPHNPQKKSPNSPKYKSKSTKSSS